MCTVTVQRIELGTKKYFVIVYKMARVAQNDLCLPGERA